MLNSINSYSFDDLSKTGVYKIVNLSNNKIYIGSTTQSFKKRFISHYYCLLNNKHPNKYLNLSWIKHGEDNFKFEIIEICEKDECLNREQFWLDNTKCYNPDIGYNISMKATGFTKGFTPWNKGKPSSEEWKQKLRKPKNISSGWREHRKKIGRDKAKPVLIYDYLGNYISKFESRHDIEDFSITELNNLPMILKNKIGRNNKSEKILKAENISNCCNGRTKHYKGLQFRYENSEIPVLVLSIDDILRKCRATKKLVDDKSDELRESLEADNTEPS